MGAGLEEEKTVVGFDARSAGGGLNHCMREKRWASGGRELKEKIEAKHVKDTKVSTRGLMIRLIVAKPLD